MAATMDIFLQNTTENMMTQWYAKSEAIDKGVRDVLSFMEELMLTLQAGSIQVGTLTVDLVILLV